ncbi:MAG TPA: trypsin-like peptidase domain-containing protein [Pirellulaceae bacterium]|jgi:serine protease Do|nr:trypsin-like peptidase domain-containing protein [Pirellulaceae bacterium]
MTDRPSSTFWLPEGGDPFEDRRGEESLPAKTLPEPPAERREGPIQRAFAGLISLTGTTLALGAALLLAKWFVPGIAEEVQFAITRGHDRARHAQATQALATDPLADMRVAFERVSQKLTPSVVHIDTASVEATLVSNDYRSLTPRVAPEFEGQGSGFVVSEDGYILTNEHVIHGSGTIEVALNDGRRLNALVVGSDPETDLALIKIDAKGLVPVEWGDSEDLDVGAPVWAVGSPFGLDHSITFGILSAKNRAGKAGSIYRDYLQTDAAVNPGNSGGPLVNVRGQVIGVNAAIVGQAYQGISFSIPSSIAELVTKRLKAEGRFRRGWLGITMRDMSADEAAQRGLAAPFGAVVTDVPDYPGVPSPAGRAGVLKGDVIVAWNGTPIENPTRLQLAVGQTPVDSEAQVDVLRDGSKISLKIAVAEQPIPIE